MWGNRQCRRSRNARSGGVCVSSQVRKESERQRVGEAADATTGERVPCLFSSFEIRLQADAFPHSRLSHKSPTEADLLSNKSLTVRVSVCQQQRGGMRVGYSLESSLSRAGFEDVGDGDGRVSVHKVRIVPSAADRDPEPISRDADQGHVVVLPADAVTRPTSLAEGVELLVNVVVVVDRFGDRIGERSGQKAGRCQQVPLQHHSSFSLIHVWQEVTRGGQRCG